LGRTEGSVPDSEATKMILTVFRSRLKADVTAEYIELAGRISALAETMPGFRSRKAYVSDDGEKLTLVEFEDEESQINWSKNAEHLAAKQIGRQRFYSEYRIQVCSVVRESHFKSP
jgi:heme-degrading monooxygenase HmoA